MSLDRSLKSANALIRHRNVLTRAERLEVLSEAEKWTDAKSVYGLPKVGHRKAEVVKGPAKEEGAEGAAVGTTPAAGAAVPVAGAKGAAPAAGAKGAAPAAGAAKAAVPAAKKK